MILTYIRHLGACFKLAEDGISKLTDEVHAIEGMTGIKTRHFYNNLLNIEDARYLEIGCWQGSSSCAAMFGNRAHVILMDDFSGFGSPKEQFINNFEKFKGENDAIFIEHDCFKFDIGNFDKKFNIYLFDGDHSSQSQFDAITHYLPAMDEVFIYVCDDWNMETVQQGTLRAIEENKLQVLWSKEITTDHQDPIGWWNGIKVFVFKQQS